MDMKKFLQAVDGVEKQPVADSSDMKKFLSVVTEGKGVGNKLTSAENMVYMNTPKLKPVKINETPGLLKTYLTLVEEEQINQQDNLKKSLADHLAEVKQETIPTSKPRNFVAKNATTSGAGAHKDKKKAEKQGDTKHKAKAIPMDEAQLADPKQQAASFIRYSSGLYNTASMPSSMTIKPGVTLPIKFNPVNDFRKDTLANAMAANKLLPPELQLGTQQLAQIIGQDNEAELEERSVSQAQARTMAAAAHNPEFAKKVKIKQSVAKEFNQADKGKNVKSLPQRSVKKEAIDEGDEQ
jgi:hypothetical protein